jgi:hypothetical protein
LFAKFKTTLKRHNFQTVGEIQENASWTVHFVNICVKNQQVHKLFIQFINYVW